MLGLMLVAALVGALVVVFRGWYTHTTALPPWARVLLAALAVPLALALALLGFFLSLSILWFLWMTVGGYIMIA